MSGVPIGYGAPDITYDGMFIDSAESVITYDSIQIQSSRPQSRPHKLGQNPLRNRRSLGGTPGRSGR